MVVVLDADLPACVDDTGLVPPSSEASEPDRESAGANPDGQGAGPETAVSPLPVSEIDGAAVPGSDTACPDGGTPCPVDDTNLLNTISTPHQPEGRKARACASGHRPDRGHEIESLIGRIQQAAVSPWRSETARRAVFDAVAVVGVERISALAVGFKGAGLRPWEIIKRLEALSIPAPSASQPQPSRPVKVMALQGDAAPTNPAVQVALGILSGADFGTRLRWFKRAGLSVSMSRYSAWVPQIAVEFLADEYPRTYGQFACAA